MSDEVTQSAEETLASLTSQAQHMQEGFASATSEKTAEELVAEKAAKEQATGKPEGLPEKFWKDGQVDMESLIKSHNYHESQSGKPAAAEEHKDILSGGDTDEQQANQEEGKEAASEDEATGEEQADDKDEEGTEDEEKDGAPELTQDVIDQYSTEFDEKGELSEESYEDLEKRGMPKWLVDNYIDGQKALTDNMHSMIMNHAGGEEEWNRMSQWAGKNLADKELDTFNKHMESKDLNTAKLAIDALKNRYTKANGLAPNLLNVNTGGDGGNAITSQEDLIVAMQDPKYKTSESYRNQVHARVRF